MADSAGMFAAPEPGSSITALMDELRALEAFGEVWVERWLKAPWVRYADNRVFTLPGSKEMITRQIPHLLAKHKVEIVADAGAERRAAEYIQMKRSVGQ